MSGSTSRADRDRPNGLEGATNNSLSPEDQMIAYSAVEGRQAAAGAMSSPAARFASCILYPCPPGQVLLLNRQEPATPQPVAGKIFSARCTGADAASACLPRIGCIECDDQNDDQNVMTSRRHLRTDAVAAVYHTTVVRL